MDGLADWLKREAPKANDDFALGAERFRKMLYATERVDTPLAQLESIGRTDLLRNLRALKRACADYAPQQSVENCVLKMTLDKPSRSAELTSALPSPMRTSYAVFSLKKHT